MNGMTIFYISISILLIALSLGLGLGLGLKSDDDKSDDDKSDKSYDNYDEGDSKYKLDMIDKIYLINMKEDKNRLDIINKKFSKLNLNYQLIEGVNGKNIYNEYKDLTSISPGQLGCLLSHINILKDAEKNNYENILIFEDDILFLKKFKYNMHKIFNIILKNEKEFDIIYLGCSQKHEWEDISIKNNYYKGYKMDGTFAMIINKRIFSNVINISNKLELPIDRVYYNYIQPNNKCFSCIPSLVTVNNDMISKTSDYTTFFIDNEYYRRNKINIKNYF